MFVFRFVILIFIFIKQKRYLITLGNLEFKNRVNYGGSINNKRI